MQEIHSWLYWSCYNAPLPPLESIPPSHREILDQAVDHIQKRAGCTIPEGSNPSVKPLLLTIDELKVTLWRPFVWYTFVGTGNWILKKWYKCRWSVRCGSYRLPGSRNHGVDYLLRVPPAWNPATGARPIIFWHGLGLGLMQYNSQLTSLMKLLPDRPLLVPLQPHISHDVFHPRFLTPMGSHEMVEYMVGLLEELGWVPECGSDIESDEPVSCYDPNRQGVTMFSHSK